MSAIFKALAAAQKNFEAARKASENGHFKSKYADLSNCVDAVRGPLNDQGIFFTQTIESVESGVLIETIFCHESGETHALGKLFIPVSKHDAQGYGSAITYGRRYSLLTACGVAPEDDDGNAATAAKPALKEVKKMGGLSGIGDDLPEETKEVLKDYAAQATELVIAGDAVGAIDFLRSQQLETDERLYVDRFLDSKVRSAMSKVFNPKKAA